MIHLYHGPNAKAGALSYASQWGGLHFPPFGEGGLKMDEVRELVNLLHMPIAGSEGVAFVVGPLDRIRDGVGDAMLKTIEEPPVPTNHLILFAEDAYAVSATIRSRVKIIFCGNSPEDSIEPESLDLAELLSAQGFWKFAVEYKGREQEWVRVIVNSLDPEDPRSLRVYEALRPLTLQGILTPSMILSALWETSAFAPTSALGLGS